MEAGTKKIPPAIQQQSNSDDIFAPPPPIPSAEERNQRIREEKLSTLLASEINNDDSEWLKYDNCSTQVKLDLADMILEDLAGELVMIISEFN